MTYEYVLKTVNEVKGDHHLHKFQSKQAGIQIKSHRADPFLFRKKKQSKKASKVLRTSPKKKKTQTPQNLPRTLFLPWKPNYKKTPTNKHILHIPWGLKENNALFYLGLMLR